MVTYRLFVKQTFIGTITDHCQLTLTTTSLLRSQPNFDSPVLFSTFFGLIGSDRQRLSISGHQRRGQATALQLFGNRLGALFRNSEISPSSAIVIGKAEKKNTSPLIGRIVKQVDQTLQIRQRFIVQLRATWTKVENDIQLGSAVDVIRVARAARPEGPQGLPIQLSGWQTRADPWYSGRPFSIPVPERLRSFPHSDPATKADTALFKRFLESVRSGFAMDATRQKFVFGKFFHRPLVVTVKFRLVHVGPSRNRTLQGIERLLSFLAADAFQPGDGRLFVRRSFGKGEAVRDDQKRAAGPWVIDPAEIDYSPSSAL